MGYLDSNYSANTHGTKGAYKAPEHTKAQEEKVAEKQVGAAQNNSAEVSPEAALGYLGAMGMQNQALIKIAPKQVKLSELNGAEFILYKKVNDKEVVMEFVEVKDEDGNISSYRVATANDTEKTTTIKVGSTTISGLDEDTYYLRETKAPEGYNKLTSDITVAIDANISASDGSRSHAGRADREP